MMEYVARWPLVVGVVLLVAYTAFAGWLTWRVFRSELIEPRRKRAQVALVWLLPALGPVAVHWFLSHGTGTAAPSDRQHIPQRTNHYGAGQYDR